MVLVLILLILIGITSTFILIVFHKTVEINQSVCFIIQISARNLLQLLLCFANLFFSFISFVASIKSSYSSNHRRELKHAIIRSNTLHCWSGVYCRFASVFDRFSLAFLIFVFFFSCLARYSGLLSIIVPKFVRSTTRSELKLGR